MSKKKLMGIIMSIFIVLIALIGNEVKSSNPENADNKQGIDGEKWKVTSISGQRILEFEEKKYQVMEVDGGNQSGIREANVAVDIGFGERVYWGLTNEYGQLVYVLADEIVLQDDDTEPVNSKGRYYYEEAFVPGTEASDLDQGHVIADSLGGVANAYNITPQDSTLNRFGNQAYIENVIREAKGCSDFFAIITYPNETTQIPSYYYMEYILLGSLIVDEFPNLSPDEVNAENKEIKAEDEKAEVSRIDTNKNGQISATEAINADYSMPIYATDWLYKYMTDGDGDGVVGEYY